MSLTGTLQQDSGTWYVSYGYPSYTQPVLIRMRWRVTGFRRTGNVCFAPETINGLVVTLSSGTDTWSAYAQGGYLVCDTVKAGEKLPDEPIPPPKARKGITVRYYQGRYQKYLQREGWVAA